MADKNNMENNTEASSTEIENLENDMDDINGLIDDNEINSDPINWIRMQIANDADPRVVIGQLIPELTIPHDVDDISLWRVALNILSEPPVRESLPHINSLDHVKELIKDCKNIVVLTGAGVSVSCGIPDFRSRDGIYARLSEDYPDLPDPQSMFDIHYFRINQWPFFKFAKEIYPGQFTPSLCHRFISYLDKTGRLLRNYSQNIDTLEQVAGIKNVVQCHGSFATATCMNCKLQVKADDIKKDIFDQKIPYCTKCKIDDEDEVSLNVIKPDIVFFGESLPQAFHQQIEEDKDKADLLIVIGSSLKVRPVSLIPSLIKPNVPQILINREPLNHLTFDVELYGNCDDVIAEICTQLGSEWTDIIGDFVPKPLDSKKISALFNENKNNGVDNKEEETNEKDNGPASSSTDSDRLDAVTGSSKDTMSSLSKVDELTTKGLTNYSSDKKTDKSALMTDESALTTDNNKKKNLKRNCDCGSDSDNEVNTKKAKLQQQASEEEEEIYYLSLPPNRYLFNGAEIYTDDDSESETETETEEEEEEKEEEHGQTDPAEQAMISNGIENGELDHSSTDDLAVLDQKECDTSEVKSLVQGCVNLKGSEKSKAAEIQKSEVTNNVDR